MGRPTSTPGSAVCRTGSTGGWGPGITAPTVSRLSTRPSAAWGMTRFTRPALLDGDLRPDSRLADRRAGLLHLEPRRVRRLRYPHRRVRQRRRFGPARLGGRLHRINASAFDGHEGSTRVRVRPDRSPLRGSSAWHSSPSSIPAPPPPSSTRARSRSLPAIRPCLAPRAGARRSTPPRRRSRRLSSRGRRRPAATVSSAPMSCRI